MPGRFEYERAVRRSDLPPLSRLLALTLATWADAKTGVIPDKYQPSQSVLMEATGMSKSAFLSHRSTLVANGWASYEAPSKAAAQRDHAQNKYKIHIPAGFKARSGDDPAQPGQDGHGEDGARSRADLGLGRLPTQGLGREPTTRVPTTSPMKSHPTRRLAPKSPDLKETAAHGPLREPRLPSKDQVDHVPAEDPLPAVRTATIPGDDRELASVASIEDRRLAKESHMNGCAACQTGRWQCAEGRALTLAATGLWGAVPADRKRSAGLL